mgnify:CR=1 FL=1
MKSGLTITEDKNDLPRVIADLTVLRHADVSIGWPGEGPKNNRREGDATNAEIAAAHEFGTDSIDRRPFLAPAIDKNRDDLIAVQGEALGRVIDGTLSPEDAMALVGEAGVAAVKAEIVGGQHPPALKPATIRAKGSSKPLVDTGQMLNSCTYQVDLTGGTGA